MKKFNIFWYGEDNSHCGSCWEPSDETVGILITTKTFEEIKEEFIKYLNSDIEKISYFDFIKTTSYEDSCISFEKSGSSYCPDIYGGSSLGDTYNISETLSPEKILSEKECKNIQDSMKTRINNRIEKEKEKEEEQKRIEKEKLDYEKKLKKYNDYLALKEKVNNFNKIEIPEKPELPKQEKTK